MPNNEDYIIHEEAMHDYLMEANPEPITSCLWCGKELIAHINTQEFINKGFCSKHCQEAMEVYKIINN